MPESETRSSLEDWPDGLWQGLSSSWSQPEGQHRGQNSSEGRQEASKGDPLVAYLEASGGDWAPQEAWPEASGGSRWNSLFHSYTAVIWILVFNEWPGSAHIPSFL